MTDAAILSNISAGGIGCEPGDSELRAQLACLDLVNASLRLIDEGKATRARALFVEEGEHTLNGAVFAGPALTEFFEARQSMADRRTRHCVSNTVFRLVSSDRAEVTSICVVYLLSLENDHERRIPRGVVDFKDSFVRQTNGRWLFTRREATIVAGER